MRYVLSMVVLGACAPVDAVVDVQPHAIVLSGDGCIVAEGRPIGVGEAFTLEAWIIGGALPIGARASVITFDDVASLWVDTASNVGLSPPARVGDDGYWGQAILWDDTPHHLAATWSADGVRLFVDGATVAEGGPIALDGDASSMRIGCGPGGLHFDGVIDEVRVSRTARYTADFEPAPAFFQNDLDTIALWHLDTGSGTLAYEVEDRYPGVIQGGLWTDGIVEAVE